MAVVSQVYLSKIQLDNAYKLYQRSADIEQVDLKIAKITTQNEKEGAASEAEKVAALVDGEYTELSPGMSGTITVNPPATSPAGQ